MYPTVSSHSAAVSSRNASGTPISPVAANVVTTAPASTVIGADADTSITHNAGPRSELRARPARPLTGSRSTPLVDSTAVEQSGDRQSRRRRCSSQSR